VSRLSCAGVDSLCRAERPSSISDHTSDPDCDIFLQVWTWGEGSSVEESCAEADGVNIGETGDDTDVGVLIEFGYVCSLG
jgi:hypothetical protein